MGYNKRYDIVDVVQQLRSCASAVNDPKLDGFNQWGCKQDLYSVKFILDQLIESCPTFADEKDWLEEMSKRQTWKILSHKEGHE